ncbi:HGxxPAAW family protein [Psychromicrobium xiongbiense]|uniref:HGxxPAAW family protein n=1 Tax=Psychromicrobium xiongbiense TaxID=3051184 RepID=UPI0025579BF3|nr:HGxxPAAW family protein [Psychromicrobium sp. YIM S02556]
MSTRTTDGRATTQTTGAQLAPAAGEGHGNSPAAWTLVFVALAGALICSIAFVIANVPLFIAGAVVMVIGFALGIILRSLGFGVGGSRVKNSGH